MDKEALLAQLHRQLDLYRTQWIHYQLDYGITETQTDLEWVEEIIEHLRRKEHPAP